MKVTFWSGLPRQPPRFDVLLSATQPKQKAAETETLLGFAYLSRLGLDALDKSACGYQSWTETPQQWLVGINAGITEPVALLDLLTRPRATTRVYIPNGERITLASLQAQAKFHAKVVAVREAEAARRLLCLSVSSANLTGAAFGAAATNFEAGLILDLQQAPTGSLAFSFQEWWDAAWSAASPLTERIIDDYASAREKYQHRNGDFLTTVDPPPLKGSALADHFWIEAGELSGGSRNQIEFSEELVSFFGAPSEIRSTLRIYVGEQLFERPLVFRDSHWVSIWRLNLPTTRMCGLVYQGGRLLFSRANDGTFRLRVSHSEDGAAARWLSHSHRAGYVGVTSGGREFGYWKDD